MEHFTWSNKYSVSNEELDSHHKNLFNVFNKLYDGCLNNTIIIGPIVEELVSYMNYHFHVEEQFMKDIEYLDITKHISEHRLFSAKISKYHHHDDLSNAVVSKELVLHLWKWLIDHVMTEDKKYSINLKRPAHRTSHD